jgi:hypothetical protein
MKLEVKTPLHVFFSGLKHLVLFFLKETAVSTKYRGDRTILSCSFCALTLECNLQLLLTQFTTIY